DAAVDQNAAQRGLAPGDARPLTYYLQPNAREVIESLDRPGNGIDLLNVVEVNGELRATVRIPIAKRTIIDMILRRYETELNRISQRPKHQDLVENIDAIRLATEHDLWTDSIPFPQVNEAVWWEVWLYQGTAQTAEDVHAHFAAAAGAAGLSVNPR